MFKVDNKFDIGEECWSIYRKPIDYTCPICDGKGKFNYNGYEVPCERCKQTGKLHDSKQTVLEVCKVRVRRIKASLWNDVCTIKYIVDSVEPKYLNVKNRSESLLFKTKKEAEQYVKAVNTKEIVGKF